MKKFKSKEVTEEFWNDCTNIKKSSSLEPFDRMISYNKYYKNFGRNKKLDKKNNKDESNSKDKLNLYTFQYQSNNSKKKKSRSKSKNKTTENPDFSRIYKKHPLIHKITTIHSEEEKENKEKKKNALIRCLGLYAYGVEVKKEKLLNEKNIRINRTKEEILKCTFKPKINKSSYSKKAKFLNNFINKSNYIKDENNLSNVYKISALNSHDNSENKKKEKKKYYDKYNDNKEEEKISKLEEYTFRPKLYKQNLNKVFHRSKSIENARYSNQFIWRYNKARENYMIKKIKKLSNKDECYETLLVEYDDITNRNEVNNNFSPTIDRNKNNHLNNKINIKSIKNVIQTLRKELLEINLNDEEEK